MTEAHLAVAPVTARAADVAVILGLILAVAIHWRVTQRHAHDLARDLTDRARQHEDQAIALTRPPPPGTAPLPPRPAAGHHRGNHMVIDCWRCGCIYTWTRASGWVHDFDHLLS